MGPVEASEGAGLIKLTVGSSYSRLEGLTIPELREVQKLTDYKIDSNAMYHSGGFPTVQHLIDKKGNFPSGLLPRVRTWLKYRTFEIIDERRVPEGAKGRFNLSLQVTPYQLQTNAVEACLRASNGRGTVSACTGFGKSLMIAMLVKALGVRTLVIVPNLGLKQQLTASFKEWFGDTGEHVVIENIDSPKLKELKDFDLLIIDEAHHGSARTYRKLNKTSWGGIFYRFCFTATPFRSKTEETVLMEAITSDVIFEVSYRDALAVGAVVPLEAYYIEVPPKATTSHNWAGVYSDLVVRNEPRNRVISDILMSLDRGGRSALCLVKEIAHGKALAQGSFAFANGEDGEAEFWIKQFNACRIMGLVATTGVCGEGVDTKPCEYVILAGLGKSKPAFMQQVGRALRRYPGKESAKVIIFYDKSHKWTKKHFLAQRKILVDEYGASVVRLEV